ncbi:SH3 domain-containing protein [Reichenbachiella ulvae]|uniref:SH3 domain-containing protein n=1 Tax=Reichenbachiella ulvae TaxID=2980104 RepID=A0ABT3CUV7_9BACT|nr:SH3 domain-containing protein [Reichenbachiella ulvae]MCV9387255.1 SH3 domain-containing protein [Reichenbachiella ulvae]
MQNKLFNFITVLFFTFLSASLTAQDLSADRALLHADSLFSEGKYTESFEIYDRLLEKENEATPQMLMKMAYIKEGLGNYSEALLYLNKYYLLTSNKQARYKMEEIASEYDLEGYKVTDFDFFKGIVNRHYMMSNAIVLGIALLLMTVVVYKKFKSKENALPYAISLCVVLLVFFFISNFQLQREQVIISADHVYLMNGPSAGSDLIEVVKRGHRLTVLSEDDVWVKVDWMGSEAYIKQSKVKKVI